MNKIILTQDRMFMAVVGPSGSGKTELIFNMLLGSSFYPSFKKIFFFYKEYQKLFQFVHEKINVQFIKFSNFDITDNLSDCLLIFDDSCEEIFNDQKFVQLATSGRHRKICIIYVKHNLFQQSRWSRTIDLNTTHLILFKNLRDIQQIDFLGKQLNNVKFLRECYEKATSEPFGHLLIDLDPKTTEGLRYCSNLVEPGPTVFFIPVSKAVVTLITNEKETRAYAETLAKHTSSPKTNL